MSCSGFQCFFLPFTYCCNSFSVTVADGFLTTHASGNSPHFSSDKPITAASATSLCESKTASSSVGATYMPHAMCKQTYKVVLMFQVATRLPVKLRLFCMYINVYNKQMTFASWDIVLTAELQRPIILILNFIMGFNTRSPPLKHFSTRIRNKLTFLHY